MAAGLGFKDFTTGEVLTAADVDGYLMQGVWVFASSAARSSAVTSPQEGNMSFLKDTNSLEYYSGSAWVAIGAAPTAAFTQITPTSTANSSGSVSTSGGEVTFTSVSSVSLNGVFTSTYTNYLITTDSIVGSTNLDLSYRLRASGSDTTSNYDGMVFTKPFASGVSAPVSYGTTTLGSTGWYFGDARTTDKFSNNMFISGPQLANYTTMSGYAISRDTYNSIGGQQTGTTQFDGITFYTSTGTVSGVIRVYGYSKS